MIGPLSYIGGKRRLAPHIIRLIPPHTTYVEPFAGGAQVFFHKDPSPVEVLNDVDDEVINFLRVCREHHDELIRCLAFKVASRRQYDLLDTQDPHALTDIQRAARFLYLQKNSFAGRVRRRNFHYCVTKLPNFNPSTLPELLAATARRLERVQLECSPYERVLERYDRSTTFFYCDPPYIGLDLYQYNFADADFVRLADRLDRLSGRFLLSVNDCSLARDIFKQFHLREVSLAYTAARSVPLGRELIFTNYDLTCAP